MRRTRVIGVPSHRAYANNRASPSCTTAFALRGPCCSMTSHSQKENAMKRTSPLGWMSVVLLATAAHAVAAPLTPEQMADANRLSASGAGSWRVYWDAKLGTPQSLFGRGAPPLPGWRLDPVTSVMDFF